MSSQEKKYGPVIATQVGRIYGHAKKVTKICEIPSNYIRMISVSEDGTINLLGINMNGSYITGHSYKIIRGHQFDIWDCSYNNSNETLATVSMDSTTRVWDIETSKRLRIFISNFKTQARSVVFAKDGRLVTGCEDGKIRMWDLRQKVCIKLQAWPRLLFISTLLVLPTSENSVLAGNSYGEIDEWNLNSLARERRYTGDSYPIHSISISTKYNKLVAGKREKRISKRDLGCDNIVSDYQTSGEVHCVAANPSRNFFCAGVGKALNMYPFDKDFTYETIQRSDIDYRWYLKPDVTCVCWFEDGEYLYAGYSDGLIRPFYFE